MDNTKTAETGGSPTIQGNDVVLSARNKELGLSDGGELPPFREYTLKRDGNLPLRFRGRRVGWNKSDPDRQIVGTLVEVYITPSNKIVTAVYQWQKREGTPVRERRVVGTHTTPEEALDWLMADGGGKLGRSSQEAWEMACRVAPSLDGHDVETLE